jgi:hypothetical protein
MGLQVDISSSRKKFPGVLLFFVPLLAGCANPGPPHPPSLHLPAVVSDLSAERVGDEVKLRWTTPEKTTDGIRVSGSMTAQICRTSSSSPTTASACSPITSVPVKQGPSETIDSLPAALRNAPQGLLAYRVAILNNRQRSAGSSTPAFAAAGSTPPAITGFHIEAAEQGAILQWEPRDGADVIELDRQHAVATAKTTHLPGQAFQPAAKEPAEMRFRVAKTAAESSPFQADAGGSLDATAHRGETYTYTAQRIRHVVLNGHALDIRSAPSPMVTVVMRDSFPPKPPTGLEAILAGQTATSPAIDLSWRPNAEADLAGYLVYRQELEADGAVSHAPQRLTATPMAEPGFRDNTVVAGHTYSYSITAVDTSGNESPPGTSAREEVRLP